MVFNSFQFLTLFPLLFLLYYAIPARCGKLRNLFLLLVSYLLYLQWRPVYALVLLGVTAVTYLAARCMAESPRRKRTFVVGLVLSLLPLLLFKYADFVSRSVFDALALVGITAPLPGLNWAIPVGISFYTFQAVGYLCDVYYRRQEAERDFLTYALFVSFFPSILSGPINKASLLLPQLKAPRPHFDYAKAVAGLKWLLWGMFMKVVVADRVGLYVDTVLPHYQNYTGTTCLVACVLYSVQIYADFAGYSLMALGVGRVLGFDLTENFRRPYFAVSVTDFWRRWHISLSTWLRDYVYIPLGGSRCSRARNYWNIMATFLVSGLWHGASWTFVVWGALHGVFQVVEKMLGQQRCDYGWVGRAVKTAVTFALVTLAWIFFRMPTLADACGVIARICDPTLPKGVYLHGMTSTLYMAVGIGLLLVKDTADELFPTRLQLFDHRWAGVRWAAYLCLTAYILLAGVFGADQFIYANF